MPRPTFSFLLLLFFLFFPPPLPKLFSFLSARFFLLNKAAAFSVAWGLDTPTLAPSHANPRQESQRSERQAIQIINTQGPPGCICRRRRWRMGGGWRLGGGRGDRRGDQSQLWLLCQITQRLISVSGAASRRPSTTGAGPSAKAASDLLASC